jgi:hypothetical protein
MTEYTFSNLILEHLRSIRSTLARHDEQFDTVIMRLGSIESQMAGVHADIAGLNLRMDRFEYCLSRIEQRLELRDETV